MDRLLRRINENVWDPIRLRTALFMDACLDDHYKEWRNQNTDVLSVSCSTYTRCAHSFMQMERLKNDGPAPAGCVSLIIDYSPSSSDKWLDRDDLLDHKPELADVVALSDEWIRHVVEHHFLYHPLRIERANPLVMWFLRAKVGDALAKLVHKWWHRAEFQLAARMSDTGGA